MRIFILGLSFSVVLASLPANAWACALNLCPMDHVSSQTTQKDEKMPCHGHAKADASNKFESQEPSFEGDFVQEMCPCPKYFVNVFPVVETKRLSDLQKTKHLAQIDASVQIVLEIVFEYPLFLRPPPPLPSYRLHLIQQKFLI